MTAFGGGGYPKFLFGFVQFHGWPWTQVGGEYKPSNAPVACRAIVSTAAAAGSPPVADATDRYSRCANDIVSNAPLSHRHQGSIDPSS